MGRSERPKRGTGKHGQPAQANFGVKNEPSEADQERLVERERRRVANRKRREAQDVKLKRLNRGWIRDDGESEVA